MTIAWNKEKIAFAASVAVMVLVVISNLPSWTGGPLERFVLREPQTGVNSENDRGRISKQSACRGFDAVEATFGSRKAHLSQ